MVSPRETHTVKPSPSNWSGLSWAGGGGRLFNDHDEFFVDQTHVHFKSAQIAFRDAFVDGPKD
eukprot:14645084-Alexandrium_andersonii.AAC.1